MINAADIRDRIQQAQTVEDFMAIDASLRGNERADEYVTLLGELNAASAPKMFAIKAEMDRQGVTPTFIRQAMALRAAGYPQGSQEVDAWRHRILTESPRNGDAIVAELLADGALDEADRRKLIRLVDAVVAGTVDYRYEANWTDVALAPAAQIVRARLDAKVAEIADHEGSEMYNFLLDAINQADRAAALDVIADEARMLTADEARLIGAAVQMRRAVLAGTAFAQIVTAHGWETVQAIYEGGDVTASLVEREKVAEFMALMGQVKAPIDQIRAVDAKLAQRVTRETWGRSQERLSERKTADEARQRIEDRLANL